MAGTARSMDIESNLNPQGRPARSGWKALGLYAAVLACVAVVAFYSGRLGPSKVACFAGGMPKLGGAAGELVAKEVAAAMADPDVKTRLEHIAEDMAADAHFQAHMEQAVAGMQAAMLDASFQERVNGLASDISGLLHQGGSGMASHLKRFAAAPGVLPGAGIQKQGPQLVTPARKRAAPAAAATMQGGAESMSGITAPLGFWDPIGYSSSASEGRLRFLREAELKNGRIAMLASLGFLVAEQYPVFFHGQYTGPAMKTWTEIGLAGNFWPGVIFCIAIPEVFSVFNHNNPFETGEWRTHRTDTQPGNYLDFDPLGLKPDDPAEFEIKQNKELNNGRLAMIGISGMIAQELVNGQKIIDTLQQKVR